MTYLVAPSSYVPINTIVPSWMDFRNSINGATSEKKRENTKNCLITSNHSIVKHLQYLPAKTFLPRVFVNVLTYL